MLMTPDKSIKDRRAYNASDKSIKDHRGYKTSDKSIKVCSAYEGPHLTRLCYYLFRKKAPEGWTPPVYPKISRTMIQHLTKRSNDGLKLDKETRKEVMIDS
jgi:hypothetical protein